MKSTVLFSLCLTASLGLLPPTWAQNPGAIPGTFSDDYKRLQQSTPFDDSRPPRAVLEKLLTPVSLAQLPFRKAELLPGLNFAGAFVAPDWQLTTLHRLPFAVTGAANPFLAASRFEDRPFALPGLGTFMFALGHPLLLDLQRQGVPFTDAINRIPLPERPDLGLIKNSGGGKWLQIAEGLAVGEEVYALHTPFLEWLAPADQAAFRNRGMFVSVGHVQKIQGNTAMVDVFTSQGSSGGTVVNRQGAVVGILSASARAAGRPAVVFMMVLTPRMREIIHRL